MKKILFICALSMLAFSACQEQPEVDPNPNPVGYRVKLVEAPAPVELLANATAPVERTLAFECIDEGMKGAITIDLTPDPSLLPMGAEMLPVASYNLAEESVVVDPATHTGAVSLTVSMSSDLEPGVRYLLPLTVSTETKNVTIFGTTIFVEVSMSLPPYQIQAKVASLDAINVPSFSEAVERSFDVECTDNVLIQDIVVNLAADATAVPDGATLLPEEAYTLPESVKITSAAGKATVAVSVNPGFHVKPGVNYVLPVRISSDAANVTPVAEKSLVTLAVSVTKNLAAIPVGGTVPSCKDFFILRDKYLIARNASTGDVLKYEYNAANNSFGEPVTIATGYDATNIRFFGAGPGNSIHYVIGPSNTVLGSGWANVWVMQSTDETVSALKTYDQHDGKISTGCGIFYEEIRGPHSAGLAFVDNATAGIRFYGIKTDGKTLDGVGNGTTGDALFNYGPANYLSRFIYKDDIYAVGAKPGILYRHKYDPATKLFSATRTEVGSNWAQFLNVCQFGDNLLCQKGDASLVMFQFDPDNYTWDANGTATPVAAQ